jgi:hypothetical protein
MASRTDGTAEGRAMWQDTAWSWAFILIVVLFGLAFGG